MGMIQLSYVFSFLKRLRTLIVLSPRHPVTFADQRDQRKTEVATFVNFIHQKDALIAMLVIYVLNSKMNISPVPIYTVHDNFITIPYISKYIPYAYGSAINLLPSPLNLIQEFIRKNIYIPHCKKTLMDKDFTPEELKNCLYMNIPL